MLLFLTTSNTGDQLYHIYIGLFFYLGTIKWTSWLVVGHAWIVVDDDTDQVMI